MALDYYLTIQNTKDEIEPEQVRGALASVFPLQSNPLSNISVAPGLSLNVFKEDDKHDESIFGTPFPDICVAFRIDKFDKHEEGITAMLKIVVWLMSAFTADMIFSFDVDDVICQRVSGQLILNDCPEFWTESRLSFLNQPYQIAKLPSLLERKIKIAPSMLASDFSRLGEEVCRVAEAGADLIHLDVMDGHFVPNLTMGPQLVKSLRCYTELPFDVHLMLTHPQDYIEAFVDAGADLITVHIELDEQFPKIIDQIKHHGVKAGIALRPQTSVSAVEPYLGAVDLLLPMSVEPGFGGQAFQMNTLDKINRLRELIQTQELNAEIEVDGGINRETAALVGRCGATILVAGTAIFEGDDLQGAISALRKAASSDCNRSGPAGESAD